MEKPDLDALGAQYREAVVSVPEHLRRQADLELEQAAWLKAHRGVPTDVLFDRETGDALDPELRALEVAIAQAERDVEWCRAVVAAAMEEFKGEPIQLILDRNDAHRDQTRTTRADAMAHFTGTR